MDTTARMGSEAGSGFDRRDQKDTAAGNGAEDSSTAGSHGGVRPWLRLFLGISGGAVAIAVLLGLLVVATTAHARGADGAAVMQRLESHQGSGMILMGREGPSVAPLQSTDALLRVTGNTVRGIVKQRFRNPGDEWLEGTYLFPLPDDAAVDHLRMKVGDRVIEGIIREKEAARRDFADARRRGQQASLVEQKRPNAFSTHVTNIAPGAVIEIEIEYQQTLALRDGAWRLRFPGVVAPRYSSPSSTALADFAGLVEPIGLMQAGSMDAIVAGDMYQPLVPADHPPLNPIRITVEVDAGVPIVQPVSSTHRLAIVSSIGNGAAAGLRYRLQTIADAEAHEVADRDFDLEWAPAAASLPMATMRHERHGDNHYGIILVNPPAAGLGATPRLSRELIFVVDTSGSMGGESIEQARSALAFGLERLQADDRFNIIQFNSRHSSLFPAPVAATAANLRTARRHVAALRAEGGTEMRGAIGQALSAGLPAGYLGQVVFITDGAVDYEDELVSLVRERLGNRRLFTVGIGSAPNGFFMRKAAEMGGGTFTYIGNTGEVERRMARLFEKIAHPVATDLALSFDGGVLAEPIDMPRDLYIGEPLVLAVRFTELPRSMAVSGLAGLDASDANRWRIPVEANAAPESGLHVLWARNRIEALSDAIRQARHTATPQDELRERVVKLALEHHLVSAYTSLVAVDSTPVRPQDAPLQGGDVPANLPAGWDRDALTGQAQRDQAARQIHPAAPSAVATFVANATQTGPMLARTATPAPLQIAIGLALLVMGFLLLLSRRGSRLLARAAVGEETAQ